MSLATKTSIYTILSSDATFAALLPGGIHYEATEISLQATPTAFDANKEIRPCALIRVENSVSVGPRARSGRLFVVLVLYQRVGHDSIDAAARRARVLLHDQVFPTHGLAEVKHADRVPDGEDTALRCSMILDRYVITRGLANG